MDHRALCDEASNSADRSTPLTLATGNGDNEYRLLGEAIPKNHVNILIFPWGLPF